MALTKQQSSLMWGLSGLLALLFVFAGGSKLFGAAEAVAGFEKMGFPTVFRWFIGLVELVGGVLLLVPKAAVESASFLIIIMIGAIITCVVHGETVIPAIVTMLMLGGTMSLRADE